MWITLATFTSPGCFSWYLFKAGLILEPKSAVFNSAQLQNQTNGWMAVQPASHYYIAASLGINEPLYTNSTLSSGAKNTHSSRAKNTFSSCANNILSSWVNRTHSSCASKMLSSWAKNILSSWANSTLSSWANTTQQSLHLALITRMINT